LRRLKRFFVIAVLIILVAQMPSDAGAANPEPTPQASNSTSGETNFPVWIFGVLALGAIGFVVAGEVYVRRRR
jgi:hypothetical protein